MLETSARSDLRRLHRVLEGDASRRLLPSVLIALFLVPIVGLALGASPVPAAEADADDPLARLVPPDVAMAVRVNDAPALLRRLEEGSFPQLAASSPDSDAAGPLAPLVRTLRGDSPELELLLSASDAPETGLFAGRMLFAKVLIAPPPGSTPSATIPGGAPSDSSGIGDRPGAGKRGAGKDGSAEGDTFASLSAERVRRAEPREGSIFLFEHGGDAEAIAAYLEPRPRPGERIETETDAAFGRRFLRVRRIRREKAETGGGSAVRKLLSTPGVRVARREVAVEELVYADGRIFLRADAESGLMHEALRRLTSGARHASLADSADWRGARAGLPADRDVEIYRGLAVRSRMGDPPLDEDLLGRGGDVAALGMEELRSAAVGVSFLPEGVRLDASVFVPEPRRGMGRLLFLNRPLPGAEAVPVARAIPPDALGHATYGADLPAVWNEFRRVFERGAPAVLSLMDDFLGGLGAGFDDAGRDDLVRAMGDHMAMFARAVPPPPGSTAPPRLDATYVFELRPGHRAGPMLERRLAEAAKSLSFQLEKIEGAGRTDYRLAGAEIRSGAVDLERLATVCIAEDMLWFSPRREHIDASLAALRSSAGDARAARSGGAGWRGAEADDAFADAPDRFFELAARPEAFRLFFDDPLLGILGGMLGDVRDSILAFEDDEGPGGDAAWRDAFGEATATLAARGDRLVGRAWLRPGGAVR